MLAEVETVKPQAPPPENQPALREPAVREGNIPTSLHNDIAGKVSRHLAQHVRIKALQLELGLDCVHLRE